MQFQECLSCRFFDTHTSIPSCRTKAKHGQCLSLLERCFQVITQTPALCQPSLLKNLPVTVLDDLKFYLSPDKLHGLSSLFEQTGIETTLAWKHQLHRRYGSLVLARCDQHVSPKIIEKSRFQVSPKSTDPHQVYMAKLCQQLLQCILENGITACTEGNHKQCRARITSYLCDVTSLVLSWKQIVIIFTADFPLIIPYKSALYNIVDLELHNITFKDQETVTKCLRKLIRGNTLKSLAFLHTTRKNTNHSILNILENIFASEECGDKYMMDKMIGEKFESNLKDSKSESKETLDLFDEALNFDGSQSYWVNDIKEMANIRDKIKALSFCRDDCRPVGGLESLNFPLSDDGCTKQTDYTTRGMHNLLSRLETVKRLDLRNIGMYDCTDVFVLLGCHHLTHLRLSFTGVESRNVSTLLFAVLFENYRVSRSSNILPLEYLGLCEILYSINCPSQSVAHYDFDIWAVKKLDLFNCVFNATATHNLLHFLRHNKSLTYLNLIEVILTEPADLPPLLCILNAISSTRCLETLILRNVFGDTGNTMIDNTCDQQEKAVLTLLTDRPNLKHLVLESGSLLKSFVSSSSFISAVTQHKGLVHLSLTHNHLEEAGVKLLQAVFDARKSHSLKGLCLEYCNIPGKSLLEAARQISGELQGRPFLHYLNLSHNAVTLNELLAIQGLLGRCVELLDMKGCTDQGESRLANFFEEEVV